MVETLESFEAKLASIDKEGESLTVDEERILAIEYYNCSISFLRFLGYCKIEEPPDPLKPGSGGVMRLELWPHILEIVKTLLSEKLIIILKSRQIGASWLMSAYDLWFAKFHNSAEVHIVSNKETAAIEKLSKCKRIEKHLPAFLRHTITDNQLEMHFVNQGSTIRSFPATASASIGYTASILDMDELEEHPYAEQSYALAKPTIDAGGQYIGVFTVNKLKAVTLAKTLFVDAWEHPETSSFKALFFPYWVRPGRDEEWYAKKMQEVPETELEGLSKELYMEQAYPRSVEEALAPSRATMLFDFDALDGMKEDIGSHVPIKVLNAELDLNVINIYQDFTLGQYFIAATDTSKGYGQDNSVTCVMNVRTGVIQADLMRNDLSEEELAFHSVALLERFKSPLWYIEANGPGGVTISKAKALRYKNLGYQDEVKTPAGKVKLPKQRKVGFLTEAHKTKEGLKGTRIDLFGHLVPAINNRQIVIYNAAGLQQFYDMIRNTAKEGRIEAKGGRNDDYPITVGICWLKRNEVSVGIMSEPIKTLDFGTSAPSRFPKRKEVHTLDFMKGYNRA